MASNEAAKVTPGGNVVEDSATTVEIKIKTLDSQTYTLRVDKCVPVPALKEQIAIVTGVLTEQQRLICRGRVLKDDQLLSAYHVEDGHTLHLVVRPPPQSATPSTNQMGSEAASGHPDTSSSGGAQIRSPIAHSFVFESVNVDQGDMDTSVIGRIISSMLDSIGATSSGTGNTSDLREIISERLGRGTSDGGLLDSTQPHPNPTNQQRERRQADVRLSSTVPLGPLNPAVIPDALTTLSQYIGLMRDEFRREGFGANVSEQINNSEAAGVRLNEARSNASHSPAAQVGLPTPASLAEILLSARQLLMEQIEDCLSQLARQLGDHTSITDPLTRMNMQSSAMRSGLLMRNLGSMFLELGRATMTLRMGQSPAEAVVNAGPANFISANGPNPLMVQAVPFHPGSSPGVTNMGSVNSGHGLEGEPPEATFIPRNIEIRIRTVGRAAPVAATNASEQAAGQQQQEQMDPARNSAGVNVVHQAFPGGDSGVRVVPLRTVVAVPSGANPSPSESSASSVRLFYPLLARVRQASTGTASDTRGSQASGQLNQGAPEVGRQPLHQSLVQRENLEPNGGDAVGDDSHFPVNAVPFVSGLSPPANDSAAYQGVSAVFVSSQLNPLNNDGESRTQANDDAARVAESHDVARVDSEQGVFFSNVLRHIMPLISQGREHEISLTNPSSSTAQNEQETLNGSSSSQHQRDPPEAPSPKRTRRD